jgi:hypothetical protein
MISFRLNTVTEMERIKELISKRRAYDREGFNLALMQSPNLFRSNLKKGKPFVRKESLKRSSEKIATLKTEESRYIEPYYVHNFQESIS